jgi:hypothetical protein
MTQMEDGFYLRTSASSADDPLFVILSLPEPLSERSERKAAEDGEGSPVAASGAGAKLWFL